MLDYHFVDLGKEGKELQRFSCCPFIYHQSNLLTSLKMQSLIIFFRYYSHVIFLTFIISTIVLSAIMARTVYSKEGETTKCHNRYWKVCRFCGMYRVRGFALMAKSMHAR